MLSLTTSPSRTTVPFAPSQLTYSIFTGYPTASITVTAPSNATVLINGNETTTLDQALSIGSVAKAAIQLRPDGFTCFSPFAYTVSSTQSLSLAP